MVRWQHIFIQNVQVNFCTFLYKCCYSVLDIKMWRKVSAKSRLRSTLTDKNADILHTYSPHCIYRFIFVVGIDYFLKSRSISLYILSDALDGTAVESPEDAGAHAEPL